MIFSFLVGKSLDQCSLTVSADRKILGQINVDLRSGRRKFFAFFVRKWCHSCNDFICRCCAKNCREFSIIVYWREGLWLCRLHLSQDHPQIYDSRWRLYQSRWYRWKKVCACAKLGNLQYQRVIRWKLSRKLFWLQHLRRLISGWKLQPQAQKVCTVDGQHGKKQQRIPVLYHHSEDCMVKIKWNWF